MKRATLFMWAGMSLALSPTAWAQTAPPAAAPPPTAAPAPAASKDLKQPPPLPPHAEAEYKKPPGDPATDPGRVAVMKVLEGSGTRPSAAAKAAGAQLLKTLMVNKTEGATYEPKTNLFAAGAFADVRYASPEAFREFDKGRIRNPKSPLERWKGPSGRTRLLKDDKGLFATWYFLVPRDKKTLKDGGKRVPPPKGVTP